jgi:hypothetical protein
MCGKNFNCHQTDKQKHCFLNNIPSWLLSGQDKCSKRLLSGRNRKGGSEIKKAGNHSRRIDVGFLK